MNGDQLPTLLKNAFSELKGISGIGQKSALRHVLQIAEFSPEKIDQLCSRLQQLKELKKCVECFAYSDEDLCSLCNSHRVEEQTICIVATSCDFIALENTQKFRGVYHILGDLLNPLMGVHPQDLNLDSLLKRIVKYDIQNIIIALNPSLEGDMTASYLRDLLQDFPHLNIERLGVGLPMGSSIEYLDAMTLDKALENKKPF